MKNIISHNCVSGRIYQMKGLRYENPFVWCVIPPEDFFYLYKNYNNINYKNIELKKEDNNDYKLIVDGKIRVFYVHYKYDETSIVPTKKTDIDIFYNKIEDYIIEKYFTRLERMKDKPIFIVTDRIFLSYPEFSFKKDDLLKYINKENCIVVTCDRNIIGKNVVYTDTPNIDTKEIANIILSDYNI